MSTGAEPSSGGEHPYSPHGGLARYFVEHREVGWMALVAVLIWGVVSYFLLPRQEDPKIPPRVAQVVTIMPGMTASRIEEFVTRPLEKRIVELESIDEVFSESRAGYSVITLGQRPDRAAVIEQEWTKLRAKLNAASLPEGCQPPDLRTDFADVVTLLLGLTGSNVDDRSRETACTLLEDELKQISSVGRTEKIGAVGEAVRLTFSPEKLQASGISLLRALESIKQWNQPIVGGTLRGDPDNLAVQVASEFHDENELKTALIGATPTGQPVHLADVFEVERGSESNPALRVQLLDRPGSGPLQPRPAALLAVEMKSGENIESFSRQVKAAVDRLKPRLPKGVEIVTVSDQPKSVAHRIGHFSECFGEAVLVVIGVALLLMEWRAALIVAAAIPLTIALTLGGMQIFGIPLHQISIAALIIALGILVDDPVVAADGINREMANGRPRGVAAWLGPFKLRRPIFFATIINIAAFLPLVLLPGDKKAFIFALPIVVTISLVASRLVSMTFIPLLGYYLLRGQRGFDQGGGQRRVFPLGLIDAALAAVLPRYRNLLAATLRYPWLAIIAAYALLAASFALTPYFGRQFFPPADRNQMLIDVSLPETASAAATRRVCDQITELIQPYPEITRAAVFLGGTAPRFYYNVTPTAPADHLAQFLIETKRAEDVPALVGRLRAAIDQKIHGARCVVKQLDQGPPVDTPIQVRLTGDDLEVLRGLADRVAATLRKESAYQVYDDLGPKLPALEIAVNHDQASALGVGSAQIALLIRTAFAEAKIADLREDRRVVPVMLRIRPEESNDEAKLGSLGIESMQQRLVALHEFATIQRLPAFATISHFGQQRSVTVKAYAPVGQLPSEVLERARPAINGIPLPAGYRLEYAGETRELQKSREEMGRVMLVSLALITLTMGVQFDSLVKSAVVMLTVPLGLIGGFAGLALFHAPLGFMAMLAIVSLAGVIVSHIIVLSDAVEEARTHGMELKAALIHAGLVRMRPVLVTVLATASGLIPLALTGGELWRPLTAIHIFGLLVATVLTLFILPVWYYLASARLRWIR